MNRVAIVAWLLVLALALAALEFTARIAFPLPALGNFNRIDYSPTTITPSMRPLRYLMNSALLWESEPDHARSEMNLNLYGFRDKPWDVLHKRAPRLAIVGDSFIEGFLTTDETTIPALFAREAQAHGQALEVYNLGVGGTGLIDYFKLIQDAATALAPDEIIIAFYANDFAGAPQFGPALIRPPFIPVYRRPWVPRIAQIAKRLAAHQPVALAWHSKPVPFVAPVPDPSNPWTQHAAELAPKVDPELADAMRRATFNPFVTDELVEYAYYLRQSIDVSAYLQFMRDYLAQRGCKLRLAYIPYSAQVSDYYIPFKHHYGGRDVASLTAPEYQVNAAHIAQVSNRLGIPFLDLTPLLREREARGEHLYWDYDLHFRPAGYAFVANALYDWRSGTATADAAAH